MDDRLEKFIKENREKFDFYEPDENLWAEIIPSVKKKRNNLKYYSLRIAAVLLIGIISVIGYENLIKPATTSRVASKTTTNVKITPQIAELLEAEAYYGREVDEKMTELDKNYSEFASVKPDVIKDFAELDSAYSDLKNELKSDICNPVIIESMIENYRLKVQILEDILEQLKGVKDEEKKHNVRTI